MTVSSAALLLLPVVPISAQPSLGGEPAIITFRAAVPNCEGGAVAFVHAMQPLPAGGMVGGVGPSTGITIAFRIDASGRPLSIESPRIEPGGGYLPTEDLVPALAASRFTPGARSKCTIRYTVDTAAVATAPRDVLYRFMALPRIGWIGDPLALRPAAGDGADDCIRPRRPRPLSRGYPDFLGIPERPGGISWTMVGFDIDAKGRPQQVRTLASDDNAALDQAGREAAGRSRFVAGQPRTGCTVSFFRVQTVPMAPPPVPDRAAFIPAGATCDAPQRLSTPRLTFPEPFRRRAIEGWAIVGYDVAPWGATGNVRVLAAEPAAAFGQVAVGIVTGSRRAPSGTGASGCVARVLFKLPGDGDTTDTAVAPAVD